MRTRRPTGAGAAGSPRCSSCRRQGGAGAVDRCGPPGPSCGAASWHGPSAHWPSEARWPAAPWASCPPAVWALGGLAWALVRGWSGLLWCTNTPHWLGSVLADFAAAATGAGAPAGGASLGRRGEGSPADGVGEASDLGLGELLDHGLDEVVAGVGVRHACTQGPPDEGSLPHGLAAGMGRRCARPTARALTHWPLPSGGAGWGAPRSPGSRVAGTAAVSGLAGPTGPLGTRGRAWLARRRATAYS